MRLSERYPYISIPVPMKLPILASVLQVWPQLAACVTVTLLSISFGAVIGWTSPYVPLLTSKDSPLYLTEEQASWVVSLMPLGRLFGAIIGSILMEYYGSKNSLLLSGIPIMIGWICTIFANSPFWLYTSRICAGASLGMYYSCFPMYVGEISASHIRGALVSMVVNGAPLGTLIGTIMGSQMSIMNFGLVCLVLNTCYIAIFPLFPQSPYHYVRRNNLIAAKKTVEWYHRKPNVDEEMKVMVDFVQASKSTSLREILVQIPEKKNRRIFTIIILLFVFVQFSGLNTFVFYMEAIFRKAKLAIVEPSTFVIICNSISITLVVVSIQLIDRCGRKILIMAACICIIISMSLMGTHFMLLDLNFDPRNLEWLPILAMMFFTLMSIGFVPVPNTILSELSPDNLKSIVGFSASVTSAVSAFISSKTYQPLIDLMSEKYVFWLYALIMVLAMICLAIILPETKGKTLQEIQEMLAKQSKEEAKDTEITRA